MGLAFHQYARVKDNYCCAYLGNSPEYVVALKLLRPQIEKQLPGINLHLACRDEFAHFLEGESNTVALSALDKSHYAYVRELRNDKSYHSVLRLIEESQLEIEPITKTAKKEKGMCLVCPEGIDYSMSQASLDISISGVKNEGYTPVILGSDVHQSLLIQNRPFGAEKTNYINEASWVLGVENEYVVLAATRGIRTTLVTKGLGEKLYKKMFPAIELA
jgi:hypothetical protein